MQMNKTIAKCARQSPSAGIGACASRILQNKSLITLSFDDSDLSSEEAEMRVCLYHSLSVDNEQLSIVV